MTNSFAVQPLRSLYASTLPLEAEVCDKQLRCSTSTFIFGFTLLYFYSLVTFCYCFGLYSTRLYFTCCLLRVSTSTVTGIRVAFFHSIAFFRSIAFFHSIAFFRSIAFFHSIIRMCTLYARVLGFAVLD